MFKIVAYLLIFLVSACSSSPTREDAAKDTARADLVRAKAEQARAESRQRQATAELAEVPAWVLDIPKPDDRGVYAVGTAKSDDISIVVRKAMLDAQFGLAKQIQQEISGTESSVRTEAGGRRATDVYRSTISTLVSRVPVVAVETLRNELKVLPSGQYASYVLLLLPYEEINRVLTQQRIDASDASTQSALNDLDRRIRERQDARIREADASQRSRLAELSQRAALVNAAAPVVVNPPALPASAPESTSR